MKGTYNTGEGLQSTASESGLDAILFKNNKHLGTGTNSLQSSDIPTDEDDLSLGETEQYCSSPTAPRTSPTVPSSTPRESPQPSETLNRDSLQQAETGEEGTSESEDDNDHSQQTPGVSSFEKWLIIGSCCNSFHLHIFPYVFCHGKGEDLCFHFANILINRRLRLS